jgi:uncharacterized protein (DUF58 family)
MLALVLGIAGLSVLLIVLYPDELRLIVWPWAALLVTAIFDLLLTVPARGIIPEAELPSKGFAGQDVTLSLRVSARRLPAKIALRFSHDPGLGISETLPVDMPSATPEVAVDIPLTLRERGTQTITKLWGNYTSRLHLFDVLPFWPLDLTITVVPDISPVLSGAIEAKMLPLLDGARVMNLKGTGSEFHQLREFVPGMDPRSIDWKRSARVNAMVARETRVERNHQIIMALDSGHLMAERLGDLRRLDHAIHAALALCWASGLAGDNVGFFSFAARPGNLIPPRSGRAAFGAIQANCADLQVQEAETNHTLGLSVLNGKLKRRSLVVVFSDFVDTTSAELLVENLSVMQRHHVVLYVALRDPALQKMTHPASADMDDVARAIAAARILHERNGVLDRLSRLGVLCLDAEPKQLSASLVSRYIEIKAKEMI